MGGIQRLKRDDEGVIMLVRFGGMAQNGDVLGEAGRVAMAVNCGCDQAILAQAALEGVRIAFDQDLAFGECAYCGEIIGSEIGDKVEQGDDASLLLVGAQALAATRAGAGEHPEDGEPSRADGGDVAAVFEKGREQGFELAALEEKVAERVGEGLAHLDIAGGAYIR